MKKEKQKMLTCRLRGSSNRSGLTKTNSHWAVFIFDGNVERRRRAEGWSRALLSRRTSHVEVASREIIRLRTRPVDLSDTREGEARCHPLASSTRILCQLISRWLGGWFVLKRSSFSYMVKDGRAAAREALHCLLVSCLLA